MPAWLYQQAELSEVAARGGLHRGDEVVAGHRLAVVALEVEAHAALEGGLAEQGVQHADDFGALLVDRGGVEVADLDVAVGPHRVGQRAGVLGELASRAGGARR